MADNLTSELKLEGKIFFVQKNEKNEVVSQEELDGEICLKLLLAVLDDANDYPLLKRLFEVAQSS